MRMLLLTLAGCAVPVSAAAQTMDHSMHGMPGMTTAPRPAEKPKTPTAPPPVDPHAGHAMSATAVAAGTDQPPGTAPAPAPVAGLAASRFWGADAMAQSHRDLRREHGGMTFRQVTFNLAEYQVRSGRDGYRWDGEGWIGGDIHRLTVKSEGAGAVGDRVDHAEIQALYSRAIDPYWNLQAGVRQDVQRGGRTYAVIGIEGLAPYWFDVEGALFLSDRGDLLARAEAWYDQRITQDIVLQPRVELNLSAQDIAADRIGSGVTDAEVGVRLRYERQRELAPYIGVSWERQFGDTARLSRVRGGETDGFSLVAGVRAWL